MAETGTIVKALLGLWIAGAVTGAFLGKHYSPDPSNEDDIRGYILEHIQPSAGTGTEPPSLVANCGVDRYRYVPSTGELVSGTDLKAFGAPVNVGRRFEVGEVTVAAGAIGFAPKTVPQVFEAFSTLESKSVIAAGVVGIVLSVYGGYALTHQPDLPCKAQRPFLDDKEFWKKVADAQSAGVIHLK